MRTLVLMFLGCCLLSCNSEKDSEKNGYSSGSIKETTSLSPELKESTARGAKIYNNFCATCHLGAGQGIANAFPPLNNSDWLKKKRRESIAAVKNGLNGPIKVNGQEYNSVMTDLGLTDQEVMDVMNYIFTAWDNNIGPPVSLEEVEGIE